MSDPKTLDCPTDEEMQDALEGESEHFQQYEKHMSKQIQVSQLLATPDATYINGDVSGHLTGIRPPNGRGPSKAKLQDSTGSIEVSLWGGGVSHWEGQYVTFSGKGMQIKEFRGAKQLSVGDKVTISKASEPDSVPGDPPARPAPQVATTVARNRPAEPSGGASLKVNLPAGQTVGMAVKLAGDMLLSENKDFIAEKDWAHRLRAAAHQIIAVSRSLETDTALDADAFEPPPF